ncbi:uncharacterized protein LOC123553156 [Mercenaria mercenaria]|uniref:uncharacterized protein LOC123553156 n=1 Tax=Mercenaria mercenaria TaxID=6596 RepID=UPI00234F77DC|nr:uncharacterized protein LOC123553156 [Mercenaria mercenaria]
MSRLHKKGPPKHLERTLFINHKEDMMLDDKLHDLNLKSRLRIMEMDRERIKVRNEWRNSRKKQITINEAMSGGLLPPADFSVPGRSPNPARNMSMFPPAQIGPKRQTLSVNMASNNRLTTSAPPQRIFGATNTESPPLSRSSSVIQPKVHTRVSSTNQFAKQPVIPEGDENGRDSMSRRGSEGSVGMYVLDEFQKMSDVVPGILRTLAKKKEQQHEADERARLRDMRHDINVDQAMENLLDYEPDMNKVRKTVSSVKKLRHRMAISKKLETSKPQKSLDQMIRDKTDNTGEYNEYTDGTCALMKRRLEKKRRESAPFAMDPSFMQRRQSITNGNFDGSPASRRGSLAQEPFMRRGSTFPGTMTRSSTTLSLRSINDSDEESAFIDEDVLVKRQRVMGELEKYRSLKNRVDQFLIAKAETYGPRDTVIEEIIPIQ